MTTLNVQIEPSWKAVLKDEFNKDYFVDLAQKLKKDKRSGKVIYPPGPLLFSAFEHTPLSKVKAVIIGQDPYHGPGQAHGLCFSVREGMAHPPSLVNIFKELKNDLNIAYPKKGDLTPWADQGVLLLNAILTVEGGKPGSHQGWGWETFTDAVISHLSESCDGIVFLLWGSYAKKKGVNIDREKHLILSCGHPSPLSANKGHWFGNGHFSQTNDYLIDKGKSPINWDLKDI